METTEQPEQLVHKVPQVAPAGQQVPPVPLGPPEQLVREGRMVRLARRVRWGPRAFKVLPVPPAPPVQQG